MSHISCVQTLVKASGKKSSKVFFLPKLLLSFTSTRPDACLDLRVKSGAFVPTGNAIISGCLINCGLVLTLARHTVHHSHSPVNWFISFSKRREHFPRVFGRFDLGPN